MLNLHERPLRICLLSYRNHPYCGGQGVYIDNLYRSLKKLGHHVDIITGPPYHAPKDDIHIRQLPCLDLYNIEKPFRTPALKELTDPANLIEWLSVISMGFPEPFTFGLRASRYLTRHFKQYDVVHDNQSLSYGIASIKKNLPTVATIHHPITIDRKIAIKSASTFREKIQQMRWYSFLTMQKRVAKSLPFIITVSKQTVNDISREFDIPKEKFRIIPNGVDIEHFYPIPEIHCEKNRILVTTSSDVPLKGLEFLLRAVSKISQSRSLKLIVVGTPNRNGRIDSLVKELGISDIVTFTGPIDQEEFMVQYSKAYLAVIPSLYEGFGLPAIEAMACSVPIISTTGGALPEVVGDAGLLVPPENEQALARAIEILFDHPDFAQRLGRKGFQRVKEHFTLQKLAEKYISVYHEAIDAHSRFYKIEH